MADPADGGTATSEPGTRGRLTVRERVVEQISVRTAAQVPGTVAHATAMDKVIRSALPRAEVALAAGHVHATVHIAVAWPHPAADIAARVREEVTYQLGTLTGLIVDGVDVSIDAVLPPDEPHRRVQ